MQKVIQRAATARKQAQKKVYRAQQAVKVVDRQQVLRQRKDYNRALITGLKESRDARWEDWEKGSLAPMRHVGPDATRYGAVDVSLMHPPGHPQAPPPERDPVRRRRPSLGRDKGKINEITQINVESETVIIKDVNMAEVTVPEFAKLSMGISTDTVAQGMPVSMNDIRHVVALEMEDGTKDHIVQHAYGGPPYLERFHDSKLPRFSRYIAGLDIEIPWPAEEPPHAEVAECDTRGNEVADVSWVPSMDESPFPSSVIDELRNKYSRFRTRHDPEYVKEKVMEEYRQEYLKSQSLLTPKGEKKLATANASMASKLAKLDANGNVVMDKETNDFISRFMGMNATKSSKSTNSQASA
ncbi:uncharacterized protein N7503_010869 [Penicillium pulvis]|uniref:uncharacterized protein n=1 Tax=Penicillium pulvis TaxID=1562058 RepID=UPI0025487EBF|nr:uncharacterized protein N7503_010869 [Penicillium pulvis]KAJ5785657.1 hypothetical protein N7503_010869 [Penicillium pulvis]